MLLIPSFDRRKLKWHWAAFPFRQLRFEAPILHFETMNKGQNTLHAVILKLSLAKVTIKMIPKEIVSKTILELMPNNFKNEPKLNTYARRQQNSTALCF